MMSFSYHNALVALGAIEFEPLVKFYRQLLGQEPSPYQPATYAEFQLSGLRLGIFRPKTDCQSEFSDSRGSGLSLCLEVKDLETAIAHLTEIGYPLKGEIQTAAHGREIYAYDPAGNRLILHQGIQ